MKKINYNTIQKYMNTIHHSTVISNYYVGCFTLERMIEGGIFQIPKELGWFRLKAYSGL